MAAMISKNEDCRILANNTACLRSVVLRKKSYSMALKGSAMLLSTIYR